MYLPAFRRAAALLKEAAVTTALQPHQQRVVDKLKKPDQPGLVVAHGLGSGKTLTSIAAQDALQMPADVVVPAALQANYKKELRKHTKGKHPKTNIVSMQNIARKGTPPKNDMLIVDEAHRARETGTKTYETLKKNKAKKRMLLTGSVLYNRPSDLSPLVNIAAGSKVLPEDRQHFEDRYVAQLRQSPSFWASMRGVKGSETPVLNPNRRPELKRILNKWVDYHEGQQENFPEVRRENIRVPMAGPQLDIYDTLMRQAPYWVRYKVRKGLPPTKQEAGDLNAFLTGVRQVSNYSQPYHTEGEPSSPKIDRAYKELKKRLDADPKAKAVVYSNYLAAGIDPYKKKLDQEGIPYGEFTGKMGKEERDALVRAYNENKIRALLLSSAGGEGLDLKGTRLMQILEPHWNEEKLRQVEGRGIRYGSHADLPPDSRNVTVQRFFATRPRSGILEKLKLRKPGMGVDEYLDQISHEKERLNQQFRALMREREGHE